MFSSSSPPHVSQALAYATYRYAVLGIRFSRRFVPGVGDRGGNLSGLQRVMGPNAFGWADLSDAQWRAWRGNLAPLLVFLVAHAAFGRAVRWYAAKRERKHAELGVAARGTDRAWWTPLPSPHVLTSSRLRSAIGIAFAVYLHGARVVALLAVLLGWHALTLRVVRARGARAGEEACPGVERGSPSLARPEVSKRTSQPLAALSGIAHLTGWPLSTSPFLLFWVIALAILVAVRLSDGGSRVVTSLGVAIPALSQSSIQAVLSPRLFQLLFKPQAVRWDVCFNLVLLRMLSFAFDVLARGNPEKVGEGEADGACNAKKPGAPKPHSKPLPLSYWCLVAYALYPPLYATGPTIAYRCFAEDALLPPSGVLSPLQTRSAVGKGSTPAVGEQRQKPFSLPLPEASDSPPQSPRIASSWVPKTTGRAGPPNAGEEGHERRPATSDRPDRALCDKDDSSSDVPEDIASTIAKVASCESQDCSCSRPQARRPAHEFGHADAIAACNIRTGTSIEASHSDGTSRSADASTTGCSLACFLPRRLSCLSLLGRLPSPASSSPFAATARFCVDVATAEVLTRLVFANALLLSARRAWPQDWSGPRHPLDPYGWSADLVACLAWWQLGFLWLKFASVWRLARAAALWDGVRAPENLLACFATTLDVESFWRAWHASFNAWLVRYLYVPLGGRVHRLRNVCISFAFVALWHDLEWRLALWGALACAAFAPEAAAKALAGTAPARRLRRQFPRIARHVIALAASVNLMGLAVGNLIGFALGPTLAATMLVNIGADPSFLLRALAVVFASTQLSIERKRVKKAEALV